MSERLSLLKTEKEIAEYMQGISFEAPLVKSAKIMPGEHISVVCEGSVKKAKWGLLSDTVKEPLCDIRNEGLASKPYFRKYFYKHRCLVPADAFYEYKESVLENRKIPYRFSMKDNSVFFIAAIYNPQNLTCAIINTMPSAIVKMVHNRMPVIIPKEKFALWLDNSSCDSELLLPILTAYDSSKISMAQTDL